MAGGSSRRVQFVSSVCMVREANGEYMIRRDAGRPGRMDQERGGTLSILCVEARQEGARKDGGPQNITPTKLQIKPQELGN